MPNKAIDRYLIVPEGSVMTSGYSAELAKGQIGLFDMQAITKKGATAISSVAGAHPSFSKYEVRLGVENKTSRTLSNKPAKTLTFSLKDVSKAWVGAPHVTEQKFDEWYIGYNGFDATKTLEFKPGESFQLDLVVWGKPLGYMTNSKSCNYVAKHTIHIDENFDGCIEEEPCEAVDCKTYTLDTVKNLNDHMLPSGEKLSKYFYINPVISPADEPELTEYSLYELSYCGSEGAGEIGKVQAQYPDVEIVRDELSLNFQMLIPTSEGAPSNYVTSLPDMIPGCEGCPDGYNEIEGGYAYVIQFADAGEDESANIESALPNAVAGSVQKLGQNYGVGYYIGLTDEKLSTADLANFAGASFDATTSIVYVGEKSTVCENSSTVSIPWVKVTTANATVKEFEIILADDCDGSRLEELQEAYPELVITAVNDPAPANCLRKYSTEVVTDIVFPNGCPNSTVIQEVYTAEAPMAFDVNSFWVEVAEDESTGNLCGIHIKAKPVIVNALGECLIDELPFIATSMRVKPAGGYITNMYLNAPIVNKPFPTLQVERAQDLDNLGGNMRGFEKQGRFYFQNESYNKGVYTRATLGLENQLEGLTQYTTFAFEIDRSKHAQGFGGSVTESIVYHMIAPVGQSQGVESLLNTIAAGAGVPVEQL